jgi:hypothetical protein
MHRPTLPEGMTAEWPADLPGLWKGKSEAELNPTP